MWQVFGAVAQECGKAGEGVGDEGAEGIAKEGVQMNSELAATYIAAYLDRQRDIAALEKQAEELRESVIEALGPDGAEPGKVWGFEGVGTVSVVKGRQSEKLDRAKLVCAGVDPKLLDAATVRTEGKQSMRINAWKDEAPPNG